jgi:pilus assembly protein Flp/PilA
MLTPFVNWLSSKEEGQSMVEYALILALVAIVAITLLTTMGQSITALFQQVVDAL